MVQTWDKTIPAKPLKNQEDSSSWCLYPPWSDDPLPRCDILPAKPSFSMVFSFTSSGFFNLVTSFNPGAFWTCAHLLPLFLNATDHPTGFSLPAFLLASFSPISLSTPSQSGWQGLLKLLSSYCLSVFFYTYSLLRHSQKPLSPIWRLNLSYKLQINALICFIILIGWEHVSAARIWHLKLNISQFKCTAPPPASSVFSLTSFRTHVCSSHLCQ